MIETIASLFERSQFPMADIKHEKEHNRKHGHREDNA